jgi:hypothetical protein
MQLLSAAPVETLGNYFDASRESSIVRQPAWHKDFRPWHVDTGPEKLYSSSKKRLGAIN